MLGCGLAHIEHFCYDYALLTWRSLMGSCCGKRDSVRHQGRVGARHQVSHRVGVVLGLFALLAMLASHVIHTVEISIEAVRTPAMVGSSLHPHSQGAAAARFTTVAVPQGKVHDPFLCPVCQILSQTRYALVSTGTSLSLPHRNVMCGPCCTLRHAGLDIAATVPRAPPSLP
jgi:hypothetical protein